MSSDAQPPATRAEPIDPELLRLAANAMVRAGLADQITVVREALAAVLPAHEAMVRAKVAKGVKEYFAPADDPLYEDVRILCDRIERGEV